MAFDTIEGRRVVSHANEQTFIISDFFSVYDKGSTSPRIYNWDEMLSVAETQKDFVIETVDKTYHISKDSIGDTKKFLIFRTVLEGALADHPSVNYSFGKRIIPPKTIYKSCDTPTDAYVATGLYSEKEINQGNVILMQSRIRKFIWLLASMAAIAIFVCLQLFIGNIQRNWFYFVPISVFGAVIITMLFYLVCIIIARCKYAILFKSDPSLTQQMNFVVCREGFAAVESVVDRHTDLIPWTEAAYFIETNYMFIMIKNNKTIFWLPKRLFSKENQSKLSDFIAAKLQQR